MNRQRRRKDAASIRSALFPVRMTPDELSALRNLADERSCSVGAAIRWAVRKLILGEPDETAFRNANKLAPVSLTFDEYQTAALQTANSKLDLLYALAKLCSEAGEALQLECKSVYHGKEYLVADAAEELGDVLWYLALAAQELDLSLDDIAAANIAKLRHRHGTTYNPEHYKEGAQ